ncbi:Caleosin related protein-domain-containing protein [Annulohypoxylon nitens]|nr:Caleosin related protein-domain-containing protein [Annulohypoxylon nitens]
MDGRKRLQKSRTPAEDPSKHSHRLKTRIFSLRRKGAPKPPAPPSPEKDPHTPADVKVRRHRSLSPERKALPVIKVDYAPSDDSVATRKHRRPLSENIYPNHHAPGGIQPRTNILLLPERSEKRLSQRLDLGQIDQLPLHEKPEIIIMGNRAITTYEPTFLLRKNAEYFDDDRDGIVWPRDTYEGCRDLGWGILPSYLTVFTLHLVLSYSTCPGYMPDLHCRIRYDNTHSGQYGSVKVDERGRPRRNRACESILVKYDKINKGGLTFNDLLQFFNQQRTEYNIRGWIVTVFEWLTLYQFLWPNNGIMRSDDIRAAFNGTILHKKAEEHYLKFQLRWKVGSEDKFGSARRPNPVKLAVAVISGIVVMIWALRKMSQNPPDWAAHWWTKHNILQGADAAEPGLFDHW